MLIDWFTVGAQLINFLLLMWLMKRFLYKPILNAIDLREKRIAKEIADADKKKADAQKESDEFKNKNAVFDRERAALLSKATSEAQVERERLLKEARSAADALTTKRQEALRSEEQRIHRAIRSRTESEVFSIARKALTDLAGANLEERMVDVFLHRLTGLNAEEKSQLVSALKTSPSPVIVHSAFQLSPPLCVSLESAIKGVLGANTGVNFETAPDLISGIELIVNGQKVAWSIAEYLNSLEEGVQKLLQEKEKLEVKAKTKPIVVNP